jgi:hypothetical protein
MGTINFKEFTLYGDIARKSSQTADVREEVANLLYTRCYGIRAHDLAFRIFRSEGAISVSGTEMALVRKIAGDFCTPAFIDALDALDVQDDNNKEERV